MKRCPECNSYFPDAEQFCELDGAPLEPVEDAPNPLPIAPQPRSNVGLLPIGILAGVVLGILLVLVYFAVSRRTAPENSNATNSSSSAQQQELLQTRQPAPPVTASPSVEPSEEPSPSPSTEAPSPQTTPAQIVNSSNPISTAASSKGSPVVIKLESGLTIEADDAWQTGEGIWYRKHGVVSLLDPKTVKAIEKVPPPAPQPSAAATPSP